MTSYSRESLLNVDRRLTSDDLKGMVFLSREVLDYAQLKTIDRTIDLIRELEKKFVPRTADGKTYKWIDLFQELLYHVGRMDLLKILNTSKEAIHERLKVMCLVDGFTLLLFEIRQELIPEELDRIKFEYGDGSADLNATSDPLDFFMSLERRAIIGPDMVEKLEEIVQSIDQKDILSKVQKFKAAHIPQRHQSSNSSSLERGILRPPPSDMAGIVYPPVSQTFTNQRDFPPSHGPQGIGILQENNRPQERNPPRHKTQEEFVSSFYPEQEAPAGIEHQRKPRHTQPQEVIGPLSEDDEMPRYKMDAVPRGYCLIINNQSFHQANPADPFCIKLSSRNGSDVDREKLKNLFERLCFMVIVRDDLTSTELKSTVKDYAKRTHDNFDCFVMVVLSHGYHGGVYGVDGYGVLLDDLKNPFKPTNCPSLAHKPKMFIVQACQGKDEQPTVHCQDPSADSPTSLEPDQPGDHHHNPHRHHAPGDSISNEVDFLIAYATIPGFVSYRSQSKGSWFITKLVEVFDRWHQRHDLLSLLTKVNEEISKSTAKLKGGHYKQTTVPLTTLRKKVFL